MSQTVTHDLRRDAGRLAALGGLSLVLVVPGLAVAFVTIVALDASGMLAPGPVRDLLVTGLPALSIAGGIASVARSWFDRTWMVVLIAAVAFLASVLLVATLIEWMGIPWCGRCPGGPFTY